MHTLPVLPAWDLTLRDVLANVPTDAASIFVYALVLVSVIAIARASRPKKRTPQGMIR